MLFNVNFVTKILSESDNAFDVDGMINPSFYNDGTNVVKINNQIINPTEKYTVDIPNGVLQGKFNIDFVNGGGTNLVIVNYGLYGGLFAEPTTGRIIQGGQITCS